jgi:hypothetical protein
MSNTAPTLGQRRSGASAGPPLILGSASGRAPDERPRGALGGPARRGEGRGGRAAGFTIGGRGPLRPKASVAAHGGTDTSPRSAACSTRGGSGAWSRKGGFSRFRCAAETPFGLVYGARP